MPKNDAGGYSAYTNGRTYGVTVPPAPPSPPLPVDATIGLDVQVVASTDGDEVPLIIDGPDGPTSGGTVDASRYPYMEPAYELEQDGQILFSAYVDERIVGFVPKSDVGEYSA